MNKAFLLILVSLFFIRATAQNIECVGNTINIPLSGYKAGTIQWQFSADKQNWADLAGQTTTNLQATVTETVYFRAKVVNGSCDFFSDTTFIEVYPFVTKANAGADIYIEPGDTMVSLAANHPQKGIGKWTVISGDGGVLENDTFTQSKFSIKPLTRYYLEWAIKNKCNQSADYVKVATKLKDIDGNNYGIVKIGSQTWMEENLATTHYNDSTPIQLISDNNTWASTNIPAYCWYKNDTGYKKFGALYNWNAVNTQKICPLGWHIPSVVEWDTLLKFEGIVYGEILSLPGQKIVNNVDLLWYGITTKLLGNDGFDAIPNGTRYYNGLFDKSPYGTHNDAYWWTSSTNNTGNSVQINIHWKGLALYKEWFQTSRGNAVRCIKD